MPVPKASWICEVCTSNSKLFYFFSPNKKKKEGTQLRISDFLVAPKGIKF